MISLIDVTCPHCAAEGQIMLPPPGAIIIGPCPECQGAVAVFCGRALALDDETMHAGSAEEKRRHVGEVLGQFIHERVDHLFAAGAAEDPEPDGLSADALEFADEGAAADVEAPEGDPAAPQTPITRQELDSFRSIDLRLLDNRDYFRAIFYQD